MSHRIVGRRARARDRLRVAALVVAGASIVACTSARDENAAVATVARTSQDTAPSFQAIAGVHPPNADSVAAATRPRSLDLCRIFPPDSVTRVLRETIARSVTVATTRPGGMCTYRDAAKASPDVLLTIDLGRDRSPAAAGVAMMETRGQLGGRGIATSDIPGLGDAAFGSSDTTASYTVRVQQGVVTERVILTVKNASGASLRPAAVAIAKRTLAMMH